jgi:hypothetical protein
VTVIPSGARDLHFAKSQDKCRFLTPTKSVGVRNDRACRVFDKPFEPKNQRDERNRAHRGTEDGETAIQDLTDSRWILVKGILFLFLGVLSAALLLLEHSEPKVALLLLLAVWAFCRFYYFAFYVIERYVDPNYRFSGLLSFAQYLARKALRKP